MIMLKRVRENRRGILLLLCVLVLATPAHAQVTSSPSGRESAPTGASDRHLIARLWHGRTPATKADAYYRYLTEAGLDKMRAIPGNRGLEVLRHTANGITEFTVISYWESLDAIRRFAGPDVEKTHNLPRDPEFLLDLEPTVKHFDVLLDERHP